MDMTCDEMIAFSLGTTVQFHNALLAQVEKLFDEGRFAEAEQKAERLWRAHDASQRKYGPNRAEYAMFGAFSTQMHQWYCAAHLERVSPTPSRLARAVV